MITVLAKQVAVAGIADPSKTKSGLYIPDMAKERTDQGVVKYVGKDVKEVKVGDYVIFSGWTGTALLIEGEGTIILLPEDQVEAILHPINTNVAGLFHVSKDGGFFPATYESAVDMLRMQYADLAREKNIIVKHNN